MSAYLVHENHIRVLTEALFHYDIPGIADQMRWGVGQNLWEENAASVAYRYKEEAEPLSYTHSLEDWMEALVAAPWAVLVLCQGYQYQACEHPAWESSVASRRMVALQATMLQKIGCATIDEARKRPEYDKAPWGIGEDPVMMAVPIVTPTVPRKTRYISTTETATLIRTALKAAFPGVKFSIRSKRHGSITICWTDGPTVAQAEQVYGRFEGASFDPMQDLMTYHTSEYEGESVRFGADYISGNRSYSLDFYSGIAVKVAAQYNVPVPEIKSHECNSAYIDPDYTQQFHTQSRGMEPLSTVIHMTAAATSALPKPRVRITAIVRPCDSVA